MTCPDTAVVQAFVDGTLGDAERLVFESHVDTCEACRRLVAALAIDAAPATDPTVVDGPPRHVEPTPAAEMIGRYRTTRHLGRGGMGIVYEAHDPELRRDIALKLLRPGRSGDPNTARARLVREAQAMAQISHPNVISVYDVGTWQGEVFVAMELASGGTLRDWCKVEHTPAEIIDAFIAAGRGLAAAHAAGLVHRDFKPDNVLVGIDSRILVTDFGLARTHDTPMELATPQPRRTLGSLTMTGTVMGTPGYMAPEQHAGSAADERTDQFAFCVALWEALYRRRPFAGNDVTALAASVTSGVITPPAETAGVPAHVAAVLRRGLAADPDRRWPSMSALLDALLAKPRRTGRALVVGGVGVALLGGVTYALWPAGSVPAVVPSDAFDVMAVQRQLDSTLSQIRAESAMMTGNSAAAIKEASAQVERMRKSGSEIGLVDALVVQASITNFTHDYATGEAAAFEAITLAERIQYASGKAQAITTYARLLDLDDKHDEAIRWRGMQSATITQAKPSDEARATAVEAQADSETDIVKITSLLDQALALRPFAPTTIASRANNRVLLATKLFGVGRGSDAKRVYHTAIDELRANLKGESLASIDTIAIRMVLAGALDLVALVEVELKQFPEAMADAKASIELRLLTLGDHTPLVATGYESLARSQLALGDATGAAASFARAFELADSDVVRARIHTLAAKTYADVKRPHEAYLHAKQAVELSTKTLGSEHPATLLYLFIEAVMLNKDGHRDQARAIVEGVLPKLEASHADALVLAHARSLLARTLPKSQRARALDLAKSARAVIVAAGPSEKDSLDTLDAWLAHPDR